MKPMMRIRGVLQSVRMGTHRNILTPQPVRVGMVCCIVYRVRMGLWNTSLILTLHQCSMFRMGCYTLGKCTLRMGRSLPVD